jgi:hypothetical protein
VWEERRDLVDPVPGHGSSSSRGARVCVHGMSFTVYGLEVKWGKEVTGEEEAVGDVQDQDQRHPAESIHFFDFFFFGKKIEIL